MNNQNLVSVQLQNLSKTLNMQNSDEGMLYSTLLNTVFKNATDDQLTTLLIVANQYRLNPFTKEIYAFPAKGGGIVPVVSIDGWLRIINDNPNNDGVEFEQDDVSCTCKIYRKDRKHATVVTEYLSECQGAISNKGGLTPWGKYPKRMLRHKALIQCARVAFGFSGIYDADEAERIEQGSDFEQPLMDVSSDETSVDEGYIEYRNSNKLKLEKIAQEQGSKALREGFKNLSGEYKSKFWSECSHDLKEKAQEFDQEIRNGESYKQHMALEVTDVESTPA